jgi:hypothetical protein
VGDPAFTLTVTGSRFISDSAVRWNGLARATVFVNDGTLTATILASDLLSAGISTVTVFNPAPGGGVSNGQPFRVVGLNPAPVLSSINPSSAAAGGPAFTLSLVGSNFIGFSVVRWNGVARATNFINATHLSVIISSIDIATAGISTVTVFNPAPGGGTSAGQEFVVFNLPPPPPPPPPPPNPPSPNAGVIVDLTQARAFPNPWTADRHRGAPMTFDRVTPEATVKIFTVSAEWIKSINAGPGGAIWDLTNDAGEPVASGYYIYLITDPEGHKTKGKVAVVK